MAFKREDIPPAMKRATRSGAALVITLSLLILLTVCILAFMSVVRSDRQSASLVAATTRAEILGRSAGNLILGDILAEIRDGSTATGSSNAISYLASTNLNAVPQRILVDAAMATDTNFANLYKQSLPVPFYAGPRFTNNGPARVSDIGTGEATRNGRVLSASRWNKPTLLFGNGFVSTNQIPRWAYFTRRETTDPALLNPTNWSPGLAVSTNDNFVIGRVAYNIYEIGGALDANVAGGLAGLTKSQLLASQAGATLTALPGINNAPALIAWRNASSGVGTNAFAAYATNSGLKAGFLTKPGGDRRFVGRQDLIAYVRENSSGGVSTNSLPYLTHFSRGLDRPSLQASTNSAVLTGYPARPAGVNPAPLTIKHTSDITLPDGTKLKAGDPVAFRRFPLRRIELITQSSTATKEDTNPIYRHFGLHRENKESPWIYDHGANNRILTLAEVKSRGREPDFFEMLQAAIISGSLGGSAGPYVSTGVKYATSTESLDENIYRQILMIGANIIDQYDTDDFPIAITLRDAANAEMSIYGIENLPYINEIGILPYRPAALPRKRVRAYLQFEVWNPHQNAATANTDLDLRVVASNGIGNLQLGNASYSDGSGPARFNELYNAPVASAYKKAYDASFAADFPYVSFSPGSDTASGGINFSTLQNRIDFGYLEFKNSPKLQEPFLLTAPGDPAAVANFGYPPFAYDGTGGGTTSPTSIVEETTPESLPLLDAPEYPQLSSPNGLKFDESTPVKFAGIMIAQKDLADDRADGRPDQMSFGEQALGCYGLISMVMSNVNPLAIDLQVKTPNGWQTYQRIQNIQAINTANRTGVWGAQGDTPASRASSISFIRPYVAIKPERKATPEVILYVGYNTITAFDPRTARFTYILRDVYGPLSTGNYGTSSNARIVGNGTNLDWITATSPGTERSFSALGANIANHPSGQQYYKDPDGVVRRGDAEERPEVPVADQVNPIYSGYNTAAPFNVLRGKMEDRPVILNRAFQSVGEMGYAFRDLPWKTLDFSTKDSGDNALLDYFSIEETALDANRRPLRAGVINPNTASSPALEAIILAAMRKEVGGTSLDQTAAQSIVQSLRASIASSPLSTIANLPGLADSSSFPLATGKILRKTEKEAFVRALAPVSEVNVWNLMIDVVAQSGRFPPNATNLKDFVVNGEARYWIFAAIDRTTCKVIDLQFELVTE